MKNLWTFIFSFHTAEIPADEFGTGRAMFTTVTNHEM